MLSALSSILELESAPALLWEADGLGAVALARYLGRASTEAEGIVRWAP